MSSSGWDGECAPIFQKTLGYAAPDMRTYPLKQNIVGNRGSSVFTQMEFWWPTPLISGDRRGSFLSESRGNLKQTVPQRRKKSVVLKVREGNDNLFRLLWKKRKKKRKESRHIPSRSTKAVRKSFGRHPRNKYKEKVWTLYDEEIFICLTNPQLWIPYRKDVLREHGK